MVLGGTLLFLEQPLHRVHTHFAVFILPAIILYFTTGSGGMKKYLSLFLAITLPIVIVTGIKHWYLADDLTDTQLIHIVFSILGIALIAWLRFSYKKKVVYASFGLLALATLTGKLSVVGSEYLFPAKFTKATLQSHGVVENLQYKNFVTKIKPILDRKCVGCHNSDLLRGGLDLTSIKSIMGAGNTHRFIHSKLFHSGFFKRIYILPQEHYHMPHSSGRLSKNEIKTIKDWVEAKGLSSKQKVKKSESDYFSKQGNSTKRWIITRETASSNSPIDTLIKENLANQKVTKRNLSNFEIARKLSLRLTGLFPKESVLNKLKNGSMEDFINYGNKLVDQKEFAQNLTLYWLDFVAFKENSKKKNSNLDFIFNAEKNFHENSNYFSFLRSILKYKGKLYKEINKLSLFNFVHFVGEEFEESMLNAAHSSIENIYGFSLGLKMECAKCHNHMYAPISNLEYYNQINEVKSFYGMKDIIHATGNNHPNAKPDSIHLSAFQKNISNKNVSISEWITDLSDKGVGYFTARQYVNFIWYFLNGESLIPAPEDHFSSPSIPKHLNILNLLTSHFIKHNLSTKSLVRKIISANFYYQDYKVVIPDFAFSRPSKIRTESIRDNLLNISNELNTKKKPSSYKGINFKYTKAGHRSLYQAKQGEMALNISKGGRVLIKRNPTPIIEEAFLFNNKKELSRFLNKFESSFPLKNEADLKKLYFAFFQRQPKSNEVQFWAENFKNKDNNRLFIHALISSNEFSHMR